MPCVDREHRCGRPAWATVGMDLTQEVRRRALESKMHCDDRARHCGRPAWATVGMDVTQEEVQSGLGRRTQGADVFGRPAWATVGMDVTQGELGSHAVWEEPGTGTLDGLAYGGLVLCLGVLLAYLIHRGLKWRRTQSTQRGAHGVSQVEDSDALQAKMEVLEERLAALEQKVLSRRRLTREKNAVPDQPGSRGLNEDSLVRPGRPTAR